MFPPRVHFVGDLVPPPHPIQELPYPLKTRTLRFGDFGLKIEQLEHVEEAIDLVFEWLDAKQLPSQEIEHLAPYFGTIWPSAVALCEYLAKNFAHSSQGMKGLTLLEVGCGLALPSLLAAKLGAQVTASDGHPDVVRFLERNLKHNHIDKLNFLVPDWAAGLPEGQHYDYVVASDILYESYHPAFFSKLLTSVCDGNTTVIVTDPGRAYLQSFVNEMGSLGWQCELEAWSVPDSGKQVDIFLTKFHR
jgi:predicted nicotinamide N-methyase